MVKNVVDDRFKYGPWLCVWFLVMKLRLSLSVCSFEHPINGVPLLIL